MDDTIKERVLLGAKLLLIEKSNVRTVARHLGCSKSTVHKDMSERLYAINPLLYEDVQKLFEINKKEKHLRGGQTTKNKYLKNKEKK